MNTTYVYTTEELIDAFAKRERKSARTRDAAALRYKLANLICPLVAPTVSADLAAYDAYNNAANMNTCCANAQNWVARKYRDDPWCVECVCDDPAHWTPNCQVLQASSAEDAQNQCDENNSRESDAE